MARVVRVSGRGDRSSRRRSPVGILLAAAIIVVLPAALAFACVPSGSLGFSPAPYTYHPGDTVEVKGMGFHPNAQYKLSMQSPSGTVTQVGRGLNGPVLTDSAGSFQDTIQIPSTAALGSYVVTAETTGPGGGGMDNSTNTVTRVQRESFDVVPKAAAPPPPAAVPPVVAPGIPAPLVGKTIIGTSGNDTIVGTPFADVINCGAGRDVVKAGGGNDVINCGAGNDRVDGGAGKDRAAGGPGNDKLSGGPGNDILRGGTGRDRLYGGAGNDRLYRDGADLLRGGAGKNSIVSVTNK